jgi:type IV secretory pathway TraG/TraD family ATPase VirD4
MRRAVRERGGRAIFIEYDLGTGQALTPIYRLLVDLALKETLGRSNDQAEKGRVWFILDELKLLPNCMHLEDGLNFGRGRGCSIIAGMQSVEQMYAIYGKDRGQEICGGFSNVFAFSVSDYASRDYVRELFGRNYYSITYDSATSREAPIREREGYVVEDWDIARLERGDAVIGLAGHPPFRFTFGKYWDD